MDIQIPEGQILGAPHVVVRDDPHQIAALVQLYGVHGYIAVKTRHERELVGLRVAVEGEAAVECGIDTLGMPRPTLVVMLPPRDGDGERYVLLRDDSLTEPRWSCSTRMLVLPQDGPGHWGDDDLGFEQRHGRILLFAGLANINGWFAPAEIDVLAERG